MKTFDAKLVADMKAWLGEAGLKWWRDLKEKYGDKFCIAVWNEGGLPHPVHFREGMQVRNKLRELTDGSWSTHEYDDNWHRVIEECLV